jgi:hypothetical protein
MFQNTALTETHDLPATELPSYCYVQMYRNCRKLIKPHRHITDYIPNYGCHEMYSICTSLTEGPILSKVTRVEYGGCSKMFKASSNLKIVYTPQINYSNTNWEFDEWLQNVSPTGTIYIPYNVDWRTAPRNGNGIPENWEIKYIDPETMEERDSLYPIE